MFTLKHTLECWGANSHNQIDLDDEWQGEVLSYSLRNEHMCVVSAQARLKCYGSNRVGALDIPEEYTAGVSMVEAGYFINCMVKSDGVKIYCWGRIDITSADFKQIPFSNVLNTMNERNVKIRNITIGLTVQVLNEENHMI